MTRQSSREFYAVCWTVGCIALVAVGLADHNVASFILAAIGSVGAFLGLAALILTVFFDPRAYHGERMTLSTAFVASLNAEIARICPDRALVVHDAIPADYGRVLAVEYRDGEASRTIMLPWGNSRIRDPATVAKALCKEFEGEK